MILRVVDSDGAWTEVRLVTELWKREKPRALRQDGAYWEIELGPLPVDRLEFMLEVVRTDGTVERICAPGFSAAAQPFGAKSVLLLDGYREPAWTSMHAPRGSLEPLWIAHRTVATALDGATVAVTGGTTAVATDAPTVAVTGGTTAVATDAPTVAADASTDAALDASTDAALDAATDATLDAGADATLDTAADAPGVGLTVSTTRGLLWTAPGLDAATPAPLVVALDGPEYVGYAGLDRFLAAAVATGTLPPLRAALLAPVARDADYSASDAFADHLARDLLPAIEKRAPTNMRIGLGASLGGLAMLHAHRRHADLFDALVLQSGSFFDTALDGQESWHRHYGRITAFVAAARTTRPTRPIPIALTCGTGEENLANNRAMADALSALGYPVTFHERRDGHTWTCWRDVFDVAFAALRVR